VEDDAALAGMVEADPAPIKKREKSIGPSARSDGASRSSVAT